MYKTTVCCTVSDLLIQIIIILRNLMVNSRSSHMMSSPWLFFLVWPSFTFSNMRKPSNIFHILLLLSIDVGTMPRYITGNDLLQIWQSSCFSLPSHPDHSTWWKEQEARQSLIQTVCQKNAEDIPHGLGQTGVNKFSYSESYNLLFCRNQKVFDTTVQRVN